MKKELLIDNWSNDVNEDTRIYRYISFYDFVNLVETKSTSFTRVISWDDTWEAPERKIPRIRESGNIEIPSYSRTEEYYGQCWTTLKESDAMWRIYSADKRGIKIGTLIKSFKSIENPRVLFCGKVFYYNDISEALDFSMNKINGRNSILRDGFLKRASFKHEDEFRFLFLNIYPMVEKREIGEREKYFSVRFDPIELLDEIVLDPRATDYYIKIVTDYCERAGFKFKPQKSELYDDKKLSKSGVAIRWVTKE